jgi:hypothetical protein
MVFIDTVLLASARAAILAKRKRNAMRRFLAPRRTSSPPHEPLGHCSLAAIITKRHTRWVAMAPTRVPRPQRAAQP